jgi:ATP-dependent Clp protease ATP-binding subunit ClpA
VVEKFVLQLEAQLADRAVSIELSPDAAEWLVERGYDEAMGARPMARLIQEHIKKPLSDEVLFGKLKAGGHVRVIVRTDDGIKSLGFEYLEGPITPRPERIPPKKKRRAAPRPKPKAKKSGGDGNGGPPKPGSPVPKVPLVRA